jgi:hypothetical protein
LDLPRHYNIKKEAFINSVNCLIGKSLSISLYEREILISPLKRGIKGI